MEVRRLHAPVLAALFLAAAGCPPEAPAYDLEPPVIDAVSPAPGETGVDPAVAPSVTFSEPIDPAFVTAAFFVLIEASRIDEDVLTDLHSDGLGSSRLADAVPVVPALDDSGRTVTLAHDAPLAASVEYAVLVSPDVRDAARNALAVVDGAAGHFESRFQTESPGPTARLVEPPEGTTAVPLNLSRVVVEFSAPVRGVTDTTFRLEDGLGALVPGAVSSEPGGTRSSRTVDVELGPGETYTVVVTEGIAADVGLSIPPQRWSFTTAACADRQAPVLSDVAAAPRDVTATVTWVTDEPSDSRVRVEVLGACPGAPQEAEGELSTCAGTFDPCLPAPADCTHRVVVSGLCPETLFRLTPLSTDASGNQGIGAAQEVTTTTAQARPVITEVLADAATPEEGGEFVELVNDSAVEWDPTGWTITKVTSSGTRTVRTLARQDSTTVAVGGGGVALYVSPVFEAARYPGMPGSTVLVVHAGGETKLFGSGLSNSDPPRIELADPAGTVVAVFPGGVRCGENESAERFELSGPDETSGVGCTTEPTPGVAP